jgi:hypothetical protein
MSFRATYAVHCDSCQACFPAERDLTYTCRAEVYRAAQKEGWRSLGRFKHKEHFCPDCVKSHFSLQITPPGDIPEYLDISFNLDVTLGGFHTFTTLDSVTGEKTLTSFGPIGSIDHHFSAGGHFTRLGRRV